MSNKPMDGFEAPVHQSLVDPILVGGLPRTVAYLLWTVTAGLVLGMHSLHILPIAILIHYGLSRVSRKDPYFFDVFRRSIKQQDRLEP